MPSVHSLCDLPQSVSISSSRQLIGLIQLWQQTTTAQSLPMNAAVIRAVIHSDVPALRKLLATDSPAGIHSTDRQGCSPLFHVRDSATAAFLLSSCNANVNARNATGETPLFYVVRSANTQVVTLLLDNGADVNARDERQEMALFGATSGDMVKLLVQYGADVHARNQYDRTSLFSTAQVSHVDAAEELINVGLDVNHIDVFGQTAMFSFSVELPMAELLVRHGASVHTVSKYGGTVMHEAAIYGKLDFMRFLFDHGAAIDLTSCTNVTPLYEAASRGRREIVIFLLENGARIHGDPLFDKLPLLAASRNGHLSVVTELLARGASFSPEKDGGARSSSGDIPLNHVQVLDLMIKHCD